MTLMRRKHEQHAGESRQKYGVNMYPELMNKLRNIAYAEKTTVVRLLDDAVTQLIQRRERKNGGPYPQRDGELKRGARAS